MGDTARERAERWLARRDDAMAATNQLARDVLAAEERVAELEEALREIVEQDPVELALDPQWPPRIARDALAGVPVAPKEKT
jgi:hypothetical protein